MTDKTLVYIAGYGRSGSTLLARIMGCHSSVFTAGELVNFLSLLKSEELICSCQKEVRNCNFWSPVFNEFRSRNQYEIEALMKNQEKYESFSYFLTSIVNKNKINLYKKLSQNVFDLISKNLPEDVCYIVDSSKTTWSRVFRPISLNTVGKIKVKVIHIVRDGRGCIWSNMKGVDNGLLKGFGLNRQAAFPVFRTILHWPFANIGAHVFQALNPSENYCRIRYEDLIERPGEVLGILGKFLNISFDQQIEMMKREEDFPLGHIIAGNRMRSSKKIKIRSDIEWKQRLKTIYQIVFWMINWPLSLFYSYHFK